MEAGGAEEQPGARDGDGGSRRRRYIMEMGDKKFGDEGGAREQR